jgi:endonuclease G, mitochondrial
MATDPVRKIAFSKEHLLYCKGYRDSFLSRKVKVDTNLLPASRLKLLPKVENNPDGVLHYSHHSVYYNKKRKVPFFAASNIDGSLRIPIKQRKGNFHPDPRIDEAVQLNQHGFYNLIRGGKETEFEIGHMAAYNEMHWGKNAEQARLFGYETFHFTNSVPQAQRLNSGLWSKLESDIFARIPVTKNHKACVFTGPVIKADDPVYTKDPHFQVPLLFWKVMVFRWKNKVMATAFMMSHEKKLNEDGLLIKKKVPRKITRKAVKPADLLNFKYKQPFQVSLQLLQKQTGLHFNWKGVEWIQVPNDLQQVKKIRAIGEAGDITRKKALRRTAGPKGALTIFLP